VRAYWARGEPERAVAFVEDELDASVSGGSLVQELVARAELAVLLAEGGDAPAASAHVARSREVFANAANRRGLEGKLLLAEALVAGATQGPDEAGVLFQQAVDVFRRYSTPWLEARACEDWAHTLQRVRRHSKAGSQLRQAAAIYRRLGAGEPWFARLASLGGPDGSHLNAPDQTDGLTAREVEVLRLIARGRSNKQIANDLVLSVRTVERHIANIYVKAGVRTKAQATAYAFGHNVN
jgi:DNA-binding CsgD family transcriptional regulator